MKYLLILNRFDIDKEKLKQKIGNFYEDYGIIVENPKTLEISEINKSYIIVKDWKNFDFKELTDDILKCLEYVKGSTFFARTKFYDKIKISSKSIIKRINTVMKKENITYKEDGDFEIFVNFIKKDNIKYRICVAHNSVRKQEMKDNLLVVLENPGSVIEISDFIRLCWIFKIPLVIISEDNSKFNMLLNKAKKMTKGVPYEKFDLKVLKEIPREYKKIGFSIKAKDDKSKLNNLLNSGKIALIFGDEKFGLTQKTRDQCDYMIKLTKETKKPMRASHAFSYIIGYIN